MATFSPGVWRLVDEVIEKQGLPLRFDNPQQIKDFLANHSPANIDHSRLEVFTPPFDLNLSISERLPEAMCVLKYQTQDANIYYGIGSQGVELLRSVEVEQGVVIRLKYPVLPSVDQGALFIKGIPLGNRPIRGFLGDKNLGVLGQRYQVLNGSPRLPMSWRDDYSLERGYGDLYKLNVGRSSIYCTPQEFVKLSSSYGLQRAWAEAVMQGFPDLADQILS